MGITKFYIEYPEGCTKVNDIISKVKSYGGKVFYGGENIFRIECKRRIKKNIKKEINDMLKT